MIEPDLAELHTSLIETLYQGDDEQLARLGRQIAESATRDIPMFHGTLNVLGYHNKLRLINEVMLWAWPNLQHEADYSRPAVEAFATRATDHLIYEYLQQVPSPDTVDDKLVLRLETYFHIDEERLQSYLQLLSGVVGRPWSAADFEPLQMPALSGLMVEFMGYANRVNIPQARAHLVRELMPRYLLDRQAGNLQPRPDMAAILRQGRQAMPQIVTQPPHALAPDGPTLKLFLERLLQTVQPHYYSGAAVLSLTPHWLRFLEVRDLIPSDIVHKSLESTADVGQELAPFWADHPDPALREM